MPASSNPPGLQELTVTCHQCGSADMERLDRKEYRCRHCGAVTVISDDDADRVEEMLRAALSRPAVPSATPAPVRKAAGIVAVFVMIFMLTMAFGVPALISLLNGRQSATGSIRGFHDTTVPAEDVTISPLTWNSDRRRYEGTVYNHSGYAIDVPRFTMTLFTAGHRSGSTWSDTAIDRLLPGEYEPITFDPHSLSSEAQPERYELDKVDRIDRNTDDLARLDLTQQQLVRQDGKDFYKFVGIVQNTLTRPVDGARVLIVLYGADHQVLASSAAYIDALRPGENGLVDVNLFPHPANAAVAAYEYIVDSAFAARSR